MKQQGPGGLVAFGDVVVEVRVSKNGDAPQVRSYRGDGVGEGDFRFVVPSGASGQHFVTAGMGVKGQAHDAEESEQTGRGPEDGLP